MSDPSISAAQDTPPRGPLPLWGWVLVAAGALLGVLLLVEWSLLPVLDRWLMAAACPGFQTVDPIDELGYAAQACDRLAAIGQALERHEPLRDQELFTFLPSLMLRGPISWLHPILAFNLSMLAAWWAAALLATALAWRLLGRGGPAVLTGLLFAVSPFVIHTVHCSSLDYGLIALLPLCLILLLRLPDSRDLWGPPAAGVAMAALALSSPVLAIGLIPVGGIVLLAAVALPGPRGRARGAARVAIAGALAVAMVSPLLPGLTDVLERQRAELAEMTIGESPNPLFDHRLWRAHLLPAGSPWPWLVALLAIAGVALPTGIGRRERAVLIAVTVLMAGGLALITALPDQLLPLLQASDVLWRARRLDMITAWPVLCLTCLAAAGIAALTARLPGRGATMLWAAALGLVLWTAVEARVRTLEVPEASLRLEPTLAELDVQSTWLVVMAREDLELDTRGSFYLDMWQPEPSTDQLIWVEPALRQLSRILREPPADTAEDLAGVRALIEGERCVMVAIERPESLPAAIPPSALGLTTVHEPPSGWTLLAHPACGLDSDDSEPGHAGSWLAAFMLGEQLGTSGDLDAARARAAQLPRALRDDFWDGLAHAYPWDLVALEAQLGVIEAAIPEPYRFHAHDGLLMHFTIAVEADPEQVVPFAEELARRVEMGPHNGVRIGLQQRLGDDLPAAIAVAQRYPEDYHPALLEELGWRAGDESDDPHADPLASLAVVGPAAQPAFAHGLCRGGWDAGDPLDRPNRWLAALEPPLQHACIQGLAWNLQRAAPDSGAIDAALASLDEPGWRAILEGALAGAERGHAPTREPWAVPAPDHEASP